MANQIELTEIAAAFPGRIPVGVVIKNSGLTNKDEIAQEVEQADQAQLMALSASAAQ
jgi:hypothetical protein